VDRVQANRDKEEGEMAVGERGVEGASQLEYDKPVPRPDHDSQPFFDGTLRGELMLQRCGACRTWMWPVRVRCISCLSDNLTWAAAEGTGTLYSYTSVHQVFHPGFADEAPYNVSMVDLTEGVRIITNVVDLSEEDLRIGLPLVVTFEQISDELALPKFRPADAS
jgi:uncharacterized OB-fold protein